MKRASCFVACVVSVIAAEASASNEALVVASEQKPFLDAQQAAVEALSGHGKEMQATELRARAAEVSGARVVVSVGPLASRRAAPALGPDARIVACLTPSLTGLPPGRSFVVPLNASPTDVLDVLKRALPAARRVGVLIGDSDDVGGITVAARAKKITVDLEREASTQAIAERLLQSSDVLWVHPSHPVARDPEALQLLLNRAFDRGVPVVGGSRTMVLQGALFALVPEPAEHGRIAGEVAERLLRGERVGDVPSPRGRVVLNGRVARALKLALPAAVTKGAEQVE